MAEEPSGPRPIGPTDHLDTVEFWRENYSDAITVGQELLAARDAELASLRTQLSEAEREREEAWDNGRAALLNDQRALWGSPADLMLRATAAEAHLSAYRDVAEAARPFAVWHPECPDPGCSNCRLSAALAALPPTERGEAS
ncbi:MAG: hypothetical protein KGH75_00450 [Rhodospirillales bacterium]|nr:hypothetical protein [Rhodospirillales bacterium]